MSLDTLFLGPNMNYPVRLASVGFLQNLNTFERKSISTLAIADIIRFRANHFWTGVGSCIDGMAGLKNILIAHSVANPVFNRYQTIMDRPQGYAVEQKAVLCRLWNSIADGISSTKLYEEYPKEIFKGVNPAELELQLEIVHGQALTDRNWIAQKTRSVWVYYGDLDSRQKH
ncbi:uncharacterized protein LY89DRAFT_737054 [Mollisia scopiformis]|uniref:Uncharacterized protein n=1 Tax=Mollisia scopiformis TaxID=149040 RepID=A0A194X1I7_MOLSC|nr:uncharacterized protein LY89DRAFT_737054 [Mollisia scopiformis]KUJ14056.1 hypothetical protein LY89DRAFT_737054 [Mollisia scopiformis]